MTVQIRRLSSAEFSLLVPQLVDIYLNAMQYNPAIRTQRERVWREEVRWPGFTAVAAVDGNEVVGVAYGFLGTRERWWDKQLVRCMEENGGMTPRHRDMLESYFEVAEVHVAPARQGAGIGARAARPGAGSLGHTLHPGGGRRGEQRLRSLPQVWVCGCG